MEKPLEAKPSVLGRRGGKHLHLSIDGTMIPGLVDPEKQ